MKQLNLQKQRTMVTQATGEQEMGGDDEGHKILDKRNMSWFLASYVMKIVNTRERGVPNY